MWKVASVMPAWRFEAAGVEVPADWEIVFAGTDQELIKTCQDADCLLVPAGFQDVTAAVIEKLTRLQLIQSAGAGYDGIDCKAAAKASVPVANVPGKNAQAVAEYAVGLMIALQRQLHIADQEIKKGNYSNIRKTLFQQGLGQVAGATIGLIGLGAIGRETARILRCLGATVLYYSRRPDRLSEERYGIQYVPLSELLAVSDVISMHIPLTPETRNFIGAAEFGKMKKECLLINTARGDVVDQKALAEALRQREIYAAAIDVWAPEPPDPFHPLLTLPSELQQYLLLTPHIGGVTKRCFQEMLSEAVLNIERVRKGEKPEHLISI